MQSCVAIRDASTRLHSVCDWRGFRVIYYTICMLYWECVACLWVGVSLVCDVRCITYV